MKDQIVSYSRPAYYLGRNGVFKTEGLSVWAIGDDVQLIPINSKGNEARCCVEVPRRKRELRELAQVLLDLAKDSDI